MTKIEYHTVVSAPFSENTYIAHLQGSSACVIVDPGFDPDAIFKVIAEQKLTPAAILNTHGHSDHIAGNEAMKRCWPDIPLVIGAGDAEKLTNADLNLSAPFGFDIVSPEADQLLEHGQTYEAAGMEFEIRDTPGHSSGHIVFVAHTSPTLVFGGDVLFRRSVGRTDFPDGSYDQLTEAIHKQLYTLPDDTIVLPGHGAITTTGEEKKHNPYVNESNAQQP